MKLDDINYELGTTLDSEDYDSIGGIIIEALDRLPEDEDEVTLDNGIHLKVQGIDQNRIKKVLMTLPEPESEETDESEQPPAADTVESESVDSKIKDNLEEQSLAAEPEATTGKSNPPQ